MDNLLIYILKSSVVLSFFYVIYKSILKKETFFKTNRHFLLSGIFTSVLLPFLFLKKYKYVTLNSTNFNVNYTEPIVISSNLSDFITIENSLLFIYLSGLIILSFKFIVDILSIIKILKSGIKTIKNGFTYVEINKEINPFSFFKHIVYNPDLYTVDELNIIKKHEEQHCKDYHSIDVLIAEFICILQWMNPIVWFYKKSIKQNLEFIADKLTITKVECKKEYQFALLKITTTTINTSILNHFNKSLIKNRILMLNQKKSNQKKALKSLLILPLLALFLMAFNTKTITKYSENSINSLAISDTEISMIITKNTTKDELKMMKVSFSSQGIIFNYSDIKLNSKNEITAITLSLKDKNGKAVKVEFDTDNEGIPDVLVGTKDGKLVLRSNENLNFNLEDSNHNMTWISDDDTEVIVKKRILKDGKEDEIIILNGKEISMEDLENEENVFVKKIKISDDDDNTINHTKVIKKRIVISDDKQEGEHKMVKKYKVKKLSDDDTEHTEMKIFFEKDGEKDGKEIFVEKDVQVEVLGDDSDILIMIDGKKSTMKELKEIESSIKSMNVIKGDSAIEKYGKKAKDGVIEVTTK